jgi:hypothetical protein
MDRENKLKNRIKSVKKEMLKCLFKNIIYLRVRSFTKDKKYYSKVLHQLKHAKSMAIKLN